jgi:non-homologous end joining protein Ku
MARHLIGALETDEFDLASFKDDYRERVREYLEAKGAGKVVKFPRATARRKEEPLAEMLEKSLATARKEKASA